MRTTPPLPTPVKKILKLLGADMRAARIRRRITMEMMAERAFVSRTTIAKLERGAASVSMGVYATVLFILGLSDRLKDLASITHDELGQALSEESLPKRVRSKKSKNVKVTK